MSWFSWLLSQPDQGSRRARVKPQPSQITVRPPDPEPLQLTKAMAIKPRKAEWTRANRHFDHPLGCRCSTCRLFADLAAMIRTQDATT